jgi:hypothetical protein
VRSDEIVGKASAMVSPTSSKKDANVVVEARLRTPSHIRVCPIETTDRVRGRCYDDEGGEDEGNSRDLARSGGARKSTRSSGR